MHLSSFDARAVLLKSQRSLEKFTHTHTHTHSKLQLMGRCVHAKLVEDVGDSGVEVG